MNTTNFQGAGPKQGRHFHEDCLLALTLAGFEIISPSFKLPEAGFQLDFLARNRGEIDFLGECKGSLRGSRPGSRRTDTVKKAILNGYLLSLSYPYLLSLTEEMHYFPPMLLMTSHVAQRGYALAMLQRVSTNIILDVLHPWNDGQRLTMWAGADEDDIRAWMCEHEYLDSILRTYWQNGHTR